MKLNDSIKSALRGLRQSKVRTALTMLGVIIGIASVILLMSIGASAQQYILGQVKSVGSNLIYVIPGGSGGSKTSTPASSLGVIIKTLVDRDVESLRREPSIVSAAPVVRGQARAVAASNDISVTWQASSEEYFALSNLNPVQGMAFSRSDVMSFNRVAVLGSQLARDLFGDRNPIGQVLRLRDTTFHVVGVLGPKGIGAFGIDQDATIIIPISVGQKQLLGIDYYQTVVVQASNDYTIDFVKSRITSILRQNHSITDVSKDDFTIRAQEDILSILGSITSVLTVFLTAIAAISLIVGGIGIMNIMLVSVTERTREIGLRKAIGATEKDILTQFLVESVIVTSIGGSIGIAFGVLLTALTYVGIKYGASIPWTFQLPLTGVALAFGVSAITGLVFGVYPARQAARKNPIDALRYE
ncbi:MAG: ABC transporter permease [Candidatus Pacebacteria bacterium]|nr:ABC transporter permease [Candidatus Paceibacterota bacterium]